MWAVLCLTHHHMRGSSCHLKKKKKKTLLTFSLVEKIRTMSFPAGFNCFVFFCLFFPLSECITAKNSIIQCHTEMHVSMLKYDEPSRLFSLRASLITHWNGFLYIFKPTQICPLAEINLMNKQNCIFGLKFKEMRKTSYLSLLARCYYVIYAI